MLKLLRVFEVYSMNLESLCSYIAVKSSKELGAQFQSFNKMCLGDLGFFQSSQNEGQLMKKHIKINCVLN